MKKISGTEFIKRLAGIPGTWNETETDDAGGTRMTITNVFTEEGALIAMRVITAVSGRPSAVLGKPNNKDYYWDV